MLSQWWMFKNEKYKNLGENLNNITPHGPDDGSVEPKRYSVDFSINLSFRLDYPVINFSLHIVGLQSIIYFQYFLYNQSNMILSLHSLYI